MNILLLGAGGREHAIAWKMAQSPKVDQLFIAPGNAGTAQVGTNVNNKADDISAIKEFALPLIVGILAGAYTSIFIASTFWASWKESYMKAKEAAAQERKAAKKNK